MIAYFDAGTGSMIISAVAAGFAGIALAGKSLWYKIAFWRKPAQTSVDTTLGDAGLDDLELGEIDDSELI